MTTVILSDTVFSKLVKHLAEIEEDKNRILDEYFPELTAERHEIKNLIENYIRQLDRLVRNANKSPAAGNSVPFVIIGSQVEIQNVSDSEIFNYLLVSPFGPIKEGAISCLSPVGKSLLLKKVGDEIEVKAPGGIFRYKVNSVQLPCG